MDTKAANEPRCADCAYLAIRDLDSPDQDGLLAEAICRRMPPPWHQVYPSDDWCGEFEG